MVQIFTVIVFFVSAGFAIFLKQQEQLKKLFLALFLFLVLVPGFTGYTVWPFFSWHLYGISQSDEFDFYEMRVGDAQGNELKYDARAVRPSLATPIRRYAARIVQAPIEEQNALLEFFLTEAKRYQEKIQADQLELRKLVKFPDHQYGYRWLLSDVQQMGNLEYIAIYKIDVDLSDNGQDVESLNREFVLSYP